MYFVTVKKKCSSDREKLLKFEAEGQEFAKLFRSLKVSYSRKEILVSPILPKNELEIVSSSFVFWEN